MGNWQLKGAKVLRGPDCDSNRRPTVVHLVHSLEGGGTERTLLRLLQKWNSEGLDGPSQSAQPRAAVPLLHPAVQHRVVTLRAAGELSIDLPDGVACFALNAPRRSWTAGLKLARYLRQTRADVLHARNTGCWADAVVAGVRCPCTRTVLGFHGLDHNGGFALRDRAVARFAVSRGARFTAVSQTGRSRLVREIGVPENRVQVLPNGVDAPLFSSGSRSRDQVRRDLGIPADALTIVAVGSLTPVKRYDLLLSAVAELADRIPALHVLLVGDGPLRDSLMRQAERLGIRSRVHFAGQCPEVAEPLHASDIFVSCSDSEGMSNAVLEAMATGLGVVATRAGDNPILLRHEVDGLIIPCDSTTALARALDRLCRSEDERKRLGESARQRSLTFCFDRTAEQYEEFYREYCDPNARGAAWAAR